MSYTLLFGLFAIPAFKVAFVKRPAPTTNVLVWMVGKLPYLTHDTPLRFFDQTQVNHLLLDEDELMFLKQRAIEQQEPVELIQHIDIEIFARKRSKQNHA